jgi:hypothetical protein
MKDTKHRDLEWSVDSTTGDGRAVANPWGPLGDAAPSDGEATDTDHVKALVGRGVLSARG